jgi:hypothetical protein
VDARRRSTLIPTIDAYNFDDPMNTPWRRLVLPVGLLMAGPSTAAAQYLPERPIALADGHVTIGGDVSASYGSRDPGFYDYTDYEHSALRLMRLDLSASVKAGDHFSVLGDLLTENFNTTRPYALYLRIRPWMTREIDVQVGRIPPTFGAFARRTYVSDNILIGYPLAYQYLTTLRADALPATIDELLQKRGSGWLVRYTEGNLPADHGVPLVSAFRWDTGVQVHGTAGLANATVAVTTGTISNPVFPADNGGKQVAGRVELRPLTGLIVGSSLARGAFVADVAARSATGEAATSDYAQTAWGADAEYSRDYYLVRFETIVSAWRVPFAKSPTMTDALRATATSVEGRYKILPGLYAAARLDHLGFSDVTGSLGTLSWDAPVTRFEVGGGFSLQRNLLLKGSYQHDTRDGGRLPSVANLVTAQLVFWF